jgi:hypothetical protein
VPVVGLPHEGLKPPDTSWRYHSAVAMHNMGIWKPWNEIWLRFCYLLLFSPPGQPEEEPRARKRRYPAALAELIPGQLLVINPVPV